MEIIVAVLIWLVFGFCAALLGRYCIDKEPVSIGQWVLLTLFGVVGFILVFVVSAIIALVELPFWIRLEKLLERKF